MDYALGYSRPRIVAVISFPYDNIKGYFFEHYRIFAYRLFIYNRYEFA
jgi:hypothetical protein